MFGVGDSALESERNGLVLNHVIERAFDNGWVAIVPDGLIEQNPSDISRDPVECGLRGVSSCIWLFVSQL